DVPRDVVEFAGKRRDAGDGVHHCHELVEGVRNRRDRAVHLAQAGDLEQRLVDLEVGEVDAGADVVNGVNRVVQNGDQHTPNREVEGVGVDRVPEVLQPICDRVLDVRQARHREVVGEVGDIVREVHRRGDAVDEV